MLKHTFLVFGHGGTLPSPLNALQQACVLVVVRGRPTVRETAIAWRCPSDSCSLPPLPLIFSPLWIFFSLSAEQEAAALPLPPVPSLQTKAWDNCPTPPGKRLYFPFKVQNCIFIILNVATIAAQMMQPLLLQQEDVKMLIYDVWCPKDVSCYRHWNLESMMLHVLIFKDLHCLLLICCFKTVEWGLMLWWASGCFCVSMTFSLCDVPRLDIAEHSASGTARCACTWGK